MSLPIECRVLIVDPDRRSADDLASALRHAGFQTLEASTFPEGKGIWNAELPEVLVADIRLGQYNGLQLLVRARLERPDVAGIITCALPDVVLEAETRRFGGIFIVKPLNVAQVVHLIRSHIERQALIKLGHPADRRLWDRRKIPIEGFVPERRQSDRRDQAKQDRRSGDRRQLLMPVTPLDRRSGDRRGRGQQS